MKAHITDPVPDPSELVRVSPAWRKLCMKMMAKSPDDRFENAADLKHAVEMAIVGQSFSPRAQRTSQTTIKRHQRNLSSTLLFGVAGLIIAGAAAGLFFSMGGDDQADSAAASAEDGQTTAPLRR